MVSFLSRREAEEGGPPPRAGWLVSAYYYGYHYERLSLLRGRARAFDGLNAPPPCFCSELVGGGGARAFDGLNAPAYSGNSLCLCVVWCVRP